MKTFKEIIENCKDPELEEFAKNLTFAEFHKSCPRGDWMLRVFSGSNPDSLRELTLTAAHCANTVRHLMDDKRSRNAVDVAIKYGEGKASEEELRKAADNAALAVTVAADASASTAAFAAYTAAYAVDYDIANATADANAYAADYAAYDRHAAKEKNQLQTADICREYLPLEIWNIADNKEIVSQKTVEDPEVEITQIRYKGELFTKMETKNG